MVPCFIDKIIAKSECKGISGEVVFEFGYNTTVAVDFTMVAEFLYRKKIKKNIKQNDNIIIKKQFNSIR